MELLASPAMAVTGDIMPVSEVSMMSTADLELVRVTMPESGGHAKGPGADELLPAVFEASVARYLEAIALVTLAERVSYGDLSHLANRLAHLLQHGYSLHAKLFVCLWAEKNVVMLVGMLGILKFGWVLCAVGPRVPVGPCEGDPG